MTDIDHEHLTNGVVIERDDNVPFPDPRCLSPMRIRNGNDRAVMVTYTLFYQGEGPAPTCQAQWATQETVRLERHGRPGSFRYLGCSQHSYPGSPCIERRSWEIESVSLAQPLVDDTDV